MDILAARKRAAEQARKKAERSNAAPSAPAEQPPQAAQLPEEPTVSPPPLDVSEGATPAAEIPMRGEVAETASAVTEEHEAPAAPEIETLAVRLANEEYLVPIDQVREVLRLRETTPVPHAPEHAPGVISLRGDMLPVIDLAKRLGIQAGARDEKSRIVVVGIDDEDAGLIVDRVSGVVRFPADALGPAPETVDKGGGAEYLKGIIRKEGKLYILLDIVKVAGR